LLKDDAERTYRDYAWMLNEGENGEPADPERQGLARELARINLTLGTYTQWYWKTDLHNLMNFLRLRADGHAQYEIRVYADAMIAMLDAWTPLAAEAFREYRLGAAQLSATGLQVVRRMLAGETVDAAGSGLSKREFGELMALLGRGQ
jgi:thymidylate synthase (FAD)